jgi:hypothetical protein
MNENITNGLKRYYSSIEWKKRRLEQYTKRNKRLLKIISNEWQPTKEICKKYNEQCDKQYTLRRIEQLLNDLLCDYLVDTKIVNTGRLGRTREWKLKHGREQ